MCKKLAICRQDLPQSTLTALLTTLRQNYPKEGWKHKPVSKGGQTHGKVAYVSTGKYLGIHQGKGCTPWLWKCRVQQLHSHPALTGPEKSSLERHSAVICTVPCPEAEVPVHRLLPLLTHSITPRGGGTLILVLLHCWRFLLCVCMKIYAMRIVMF